MNYIFDSTKQKIFFTSDTHFGHRNIIKYCNRPFASATEMDETIIANWNSVVGPDDIVFHLGDFAMNTSHTNLLKIRERLNGHIILVVGNHDWDNLQYEGFRKTFDAVALQLVIRIDGRKIYLNHMPLLCFDGAYKGMDATWQLFGHVHSGPAQTTGLDIERLVHLFPSQYDVGCDNNNFTPVSFETVKKIIEEQELSQNLWRGNGNM